MKNRFLYIALSLISVLTSCKDDEFEPLNNVAECTWHVSTDQENVSPIQLNLNNYISIMDLSQGMLSHQWVVSDDGTKFLNGKMEWGQTDYTNLIDESIPHTNDLKTIHVYFTKPGDHTVRLCNTFRRQVVYPYSVYDDNTGGYMEAAIRMVNEFLPEGKLIVYTQGRKYPRSEEFANGTGSCQKMPLVVLIDEGSASASEIFTGAIQDNDRGTVVGRRSFGKGLVQQPIDFSDGSAIRLTIARYYTPSGRCIQRPYESGKDRNYELDLYNRYEHGEFFSRDSIKQNENERYLTSLGRTVYGGGGIMPDVFVPQDTTGVTSYLSSVINRGLTLQFTFQYTDNNRKKLSQYETEEELLNYLRHQGLVEQFIRFADTKGVKRRNILIQKSYKRLEANIYGNIIYNMLGLEAYLKYFNKSDATVQQGIELLEKGEAFPKAPVETEEED